MPSSEGLFIKPGIQERGTKCGECGERGEWIPGKLLEDSGEYYYFNIPGMFQRIPGNIPEDSGECPERFREMFKEISGNVQEDSDNEVIASNKKFSGLQLVRKGEAKFSDLNFYKIVKV